MVRRLTPPTISDQVLLRSVVRNKRLAAASAIKPMEAAVANRYLSYVGAQGDPWAIPKVPEFQPAKASFHSVFARPPRELSFIEALRRAAKGACPMCGSDGNGTLDHYLPKSEYPEFSFFSLNLIPACFRCNTRRGNKYIGVNVGERPIHPYYDGHAAQRLITAKVSAPYSVPAFHAFPWQPQPGTIAAVRWHIDNIIEPAGFSMHCQHRWSRLVNDPLLYLGSRPTELDVKNSLVRRVSETTHLGESPNGWDSCFFHGVSEDVNAIKHLVQLMVDALV